MCQFAYLLTIPDTVASAERSFSKLKLVKNYLHSTMSQDRLVDLARLNIESEIARKINFDNVITRIALIKTRKAPLNAIVKLEAPRSLYSSPGYNNNISQ